MSTDRDRDELDNHRILEKIKILPSDTAWKTISHSIPGSDYYHRICEYHKLMVRANVLLAGFSFIAIEENPEKMIAKAASGHNGWETVLEAYGVCGIIACWSACCACISSFILFASISYLGAEGATYFGGKYIFFYLFGIIVIVNIFTYIYLNK